MPYVISIEGFKFHDGNYQRNFHSPVHSISVYKNDLFPFNDISNVKNLSGKHLLEKTEIKKLSDVIVKIKSIDFNVDATFVDFDSRHFGRATSLAGQFDKIIKFFKESLNREMRASFNVDDEIKNTYSDHSRVGLIYAIMELDELAHY